MSKIKVEITIDVDLDKIFSEIPKGLFAESTEDDREGYDLETVYEALKNSYLYALRMKTEHLSSEINYEYFRHHDICLLNVSKIIAENAIVTKIE